MVLSFFQWQLNLHKCKFAQFVCTDKMGHVSSNTLGLWSSPPLMIVRLPCPPSLPVTEEFHRGSQRAHSPCWATTTHKCLRALPLLSEPLVEPLSGTLLCQTLRICVPADSRQAPSKWGLCCCQTLLPPYALSVYVVGRILVSPSSFHHVLFLDQGMRPKEGIQLGKGDKYTLQMFFWVHTGCIHNWTS